MKQAQFFAVDFGATSGRTIIGTLTANHLELRELTRFPNVIIEANGHFYWDMLALYNEIVKGLKLVAKEKIEITSIGIDTWGVDFALFGADGELLRNPYSYRDPHTVGMMDAYFEQLPREQVYGDTGIQFMNFNSLFQLYTLHRNHCSALEAASYIQFLPDAFTYLLTGKRVTEYTIASTSQILNPRTKELEQRLLDMCGVEAARFAPMVYPGATVGTLTPELQAMTGLGAIPVIAVAGHDTASAVAAVPAGDERFAYLSSGTWSLMGIETREPIITHESFALNFTNEGGVEGTTRFLKNICGMWLLESCRNESEELRGFTYPQLNELALAATPFKCFINPDAPCFANPPSMIEAIARYCRATGQSEPQGWGELLRCIFESLAMRYKQVFGYLQKMAPFPIERLHVIGGGSKNDLLNTFTCNALGVPVLAGPTEATAIGNVMLQAKAAGWVSSIDEMRARIASSVPLVTFTPQDCTLWNEAYPRYEKVYNENI